MKIEIITSILITLILCTSCANKEKPYSTSEMDTLVDQYANELLEDKRFHSMSIAVYKPDNSFIKHYGELQIGKGNRPSNQSVYELGSVTKTFTGILASKAVLDGKITLDDDVRKYLDQPYPNLAYQGQPVTIRHLLTHTSGFPNFPIRGENKSDFLEGLSEIKITSIPGEKYFYSNTAPELTAYILEKVYQKPYDLLLDDTILTPNNMLNTSFEGIQSPAASDNSKLVRGYNEKGELMPNFERRLWGGTVGLNSTSPDLMNYMKYLMTDDSELVQQSFTKLYKINRNLSVGYYWYISEEGGVTSYRHHGGIYGMQNWLIVYPEYDLAISIISNASFDGVGDALEDVAERIFALYKS